MVLSIKKFKKKKIKWRESPRPSFVLYLGAQSPFFLFSIVIRLPSQIAAGKIAWRKGRRPLAIAYRGLPLYGVGTVQVHCRARIFQLVGANSQAISSVPN
jgi:hypothetical protein